MDKEFPAASGKAAVRETRREFFTRIAAAGAVAAMGPGELLAQEAKPKPADPAGTIPNEKVMAEKDPAMQMHSERPLTGSVPAEHHNYRVTPSDRMFIRNNHRTPEVLAEVLEEETEAPDDGVIAKNRVLFLGDVVDDQYEQRADQHEAQDRADAVGQYA